MRLEKHRQDQMTPAERIAIGRRRENGGSSDHNPIYGRIKMLFKRYPKSDMYLIMLRNRVNKEIQKFGI